MSIDLVRHKRAQRTAAYGTTRRQTNSRSVNSRTGWLADWSTRRKRIF